MCITKVVDTLFTGINVSNFIKSIDYRIATTREELEKAYSLVYREYIKRDYTKENPSGLRLSIYNAHPKTITFIVKMGEDVITTATIISDSSLGLPMDEVYSNELRRFRNDGKKIGEISMLASNTDFSENGSLMMPKSKQLFFIFFLYKLIFNYSLNVLKLNYICITINPKHKFIYEFLLFKNLGEPKPYNCVNGATAVAKYLDLNYCKKMWLKQKHSGVYKMIFEGKADLVKSSGKPIFNHRDLKYFFVEKTDIFRNSLPSQIEYIKNLYQ